MARPKSCRRISSYPDHWVFKADNLDDEPLEILLSIDEFECIRLIDREGLTQEECAKAMGVSRPTVTAIYTEARKKLALLLVDGRPLRISGGSYQIGNMKDLPEVPKKGEKQMTNLQLYLWTLKNTSWLWGWGLVAIVLTYFIERKVLENGKKI